MDWQPPFTHITIEEQEEGSEFLFLRPWFVRNIESVDQAGHAAPFQAAQTDCS